MSIVLEKSELSPDYRYGLTNSYEEMVVYVTNDKNTMKKLMAYTELNLFKAPFIRVRVKVIGNLKSEVFSLFNGCPLVLILEDGIDK